MATLEIYRSKRSNLDFLTTHNNLKRLELFGNTKLIDVEGLQECADSLEELEIERCKNIANYSSILKLNHLRKLSIEGYDKEKIPELKDLQNRLNDKVDFYISPKIK